MDLTQIVTGVKLSKVCSIKPFKGAENGKQITLNVTIDGVPLQGVFDKAIASTVIQWQNGPGRGKYDQWANGQVVDINFKSPAQVVIDPKVALKAKLRAMDPEDRKAYVMDLLDDLEDDN